MKKIFKILLYLGVIVVPIFLLLMINRSTNCNEIREEIKNDEYNWIIKDKYIDTDNHSYLTIEVFDYSKKTNQTIFYPNDKSGLLGFLKESDSVYKENKSFEFSIYRNKKILKEIVLEFQCNN